LTSLTSASYLQKYYRLTVLLPVITVDSTLMGMESYYIDDPPKLTGCKPVNAYTNSFSPPVSPPPFVGYSKLIIRYDLYDAASDSRPLWITNYD
jgi:hypothetical protein